MNNKPHIVIIDDEKNIADYFFQMLNGHYNYNVLLERFYMSKDLIEYSNSNKIDLLICDIDMPEINGIDLAKTLRLKNPNLEIIFLTGMNNFNNAYQALKIDNVSYILKIDADESLIETVDKKLAKILINKTSDKKINQIKEENNALQEKIVSEELKKILKGEKREKNNITFKDSYLMYLNVSDANLNISINQDEIVSLIKEYISINAGEFATLNEHKFIFLLNQLDEDLINHKINEFGNHLLNNYQISLKCFYTTYLVKNSDFKETISNIITYSNDINLDQPIIIQKITKDDKKFNEIVEDQETLQEIKNYIWENLSNDVSLNAISKHLHYNPSYLSRFFKNKYKMNIKDFVLEIKINKAKHLLEDTDLFVKEISMSLGFDSISHFFKVFKKATDLTPNDYRSKFYKKKL